MKKRKEKLKGYPVLIVLIVFCFCGLLLGIKFRLNESNWYLYVKEKIVLTNNKIRDLFVNLLCFKNIYTLEEENDLLKEEILKLKLESNNFKMLEEEINFIKSNLNLEKLDNVYDILSAKVIDRDSNWYNSITINKGKDDGIKVDFMVVTSSGVVGKIKKVSKKTSVVELLSSVSLNNKLSGIIMKDKNYYISINYFEKDRFIAEGISNYDDVVVGDTIYTSGFNDYKKGFEIGKIVKIENNSYETGKIIYIKPNINYDDLIYVAVLKEKI